MKQLWLLFLILPVILWPSCETETLPSETPKSLAGNILSRSNSIESLPEESKILLNARGGMTIEDKIFTYNGSSWSNDNGYQWENANETTYITALHPHDISNLYEEDTLKDILISQDTLRQGETDITLTFKHLFASFTLNVEESLIDDIAEIKLTSPKLIERVSFSTGEITLSDNPNTTTLEGNGNNSYEFIIPPMEASLSLGITLNSGTSKQYTLKNHIFKSGFKYECTLKNGEEIPGIRTAEDFINFSRIINGKKTGDLLKYGEKQADGRMLYRLLADIDFKNVNSENLLPIGYMYSPSRIFTDTFDGLGHTISNLTIPDKSINNSVQKNYSGIFGQIGVNGTIKNLKITKASTVKEPTCNRIGILAAYNEGTIENCSVDNSTIYCIEDYYSGFICASQLTSGIIINSYTAQNTMIGSSSAKRKGGLVGECYGKILNSYAYNNTFTKLTSTGTAGGLVGLSSTNPLTITNCYIYHANSTSNFGILIGSASDKASITNNYYNKLLPSNTTDTTNFKYDGNFQINEKHISFYLNSWINENQANYPQITFKQWEISQNGYPILQ